jgi:GNAT superfamily N-acetyltransferase
VTTLRVDPIAYSDTVALRRAVLGRKAPQDRVTHLPEDDDPSTWHLGVRRGSRLIAVVSVRPEPTPFRPQAVAYRLYGMAVSRRHQSEGVGTALLAEVTARCRRRGAQVLWANSRDEAVPFYESRGLAPIGPTSFIPQPTCFTGSS